MAQKRERGFAAMNPEQQREIASKGGRAAHQRGTAHEWDSAEAAAAGRKGGRASHRHGSTRPETQPAVPRVGIPQSESEQMQGGASLSGEPRKVQGTLQKGGQPSPSEMSETPYVARSESDLSRGENPSRHVGGMEPDYRSTGAVDEEGSRGMSSSAENEEDSDQLRERASHARCAVGGLGTGTNRQTTRDQQQGHSEGPLASPLTTPSKSL
jgi:general stress protein YciG